MVGGLPAMAEGQSLKCEYSLMEALGFVIVWIILSVITFGIGSFFAIYFFYKSVISKTYVVDRAGQKVARLNCELGLAESIGHIVIWILISIVTVGIGLIFYAFATLRLSLNRTRMVSF